MASIKTKFAVGLFIAVGLALTIIAVVWLGVSKYLEKGQQYAAYFDESVQGLDRDSPVKYRGVPVGRVVSVGVAPDGALVQVIMKIETDLGLEKEKHAVGDVIAQLKSIGITGIMFLELDRKKKSDPVFTPKLAFKPEHPVIAVKPSEIKLFLDSVDSLLNQLKYLDIKGLTDSAKTTFGNMDRTIEDIQLKEISADIRSALNHVNRILSDARLARMVDRIDGLAQSADSLIGAARDTIKRFDAILAANEKGIETSVGEVQRVIRNTGDTVAQLNRIVGDNSQVLLEAVSSFNRSMQDLERLLTQGRRMIQQGDSTLSELQPRLFVVMRQLEATAEKLKIFSENIAAQPSQLLLGEPPEERRGFE